MATEPPASVHFELTLFHSEGLSPRSRNIGDAVRYDRRFQLGMRAMTAVGTNRTNWADLMMSVHRGNPEVAFRGRQDRFGP